MKLNPFSRERPETPPLVDRDESGKFAAKSRRTSKEVSQLAEDVKTIVETADYIKGIGGGGEGATDNKMLEMGLQFLMNQAQQQQNNPQAQPQTQDEEMGEQLISDIRERFGKKLYALKKVMSKEEFSVIVDVVKKFKKVSIIKLVYGEN